MSSTLIVTNYQFRNSQSTKTRNHYTIQTFKKPIKTYSANLKTYPYHNIEIQGITCLPYRILNLL